MSVYCPGCGSHRVIARNTGRKVGGTIGVTAGTASGAASAMASAKTGALIGAWMGPVGITVGGSLELFSVAWLEVRREASPEPS